MTNEEIERRAYEIDREYGVDISISVLKEFARSLVLQAYEEAAERADFYASLRGGLESRDYRDGFNTACHNIAVDIRVLKDSLSETPCPHSDGLTLSTKGVTCPKCGHVHVSAETVEPQD